MKKIISLSILLASVFCLNAQTNEPLGFVTSAADTNGVEIVATPSDVANSLGIPQIVLDIIPVKLLPWIILLAWLLPYGLRAYHAYQSGAGVKGTIAAVALGTNVPKAMIVQDTGQPVVPTPPATPPKV
jgi:hypothetical protein